MEKRVFVGSFVDWKKLKKSYTDIKKDLSGVVSGSWVKPENFHITYKFLGNTKVEKINDILHILNKDFNKELEVNITLKGLGVFPNLDDPKVLFFKVLENEILKEIFLNLEEKLYSIGYKKEIKPFIPHITILRIKEVKQAQFVEKLKKYEEKLFLKQETITVNLIESILNPTGAVYKKLN
ncbi:2'-5' RNA ligase [Sulfurihydrogenibium azorense Az-Fu1]|uniref:RNA 2',3'-cyclic phosphodiesterase n=1 Tax=Sulfurihydrogenibium azorense (strain DSM 15241 / OCM 825 / Az-Fu1) TaxID=204536 RepID=C1DV09_SULAA|nr:RNA 2',3'-cyclic phosphodiesterase [Sulfurihydrogenibium azorense]ACN99242.1 2'-5' RNA ligase [Sulfurihydrogenibium azorense Az-Fu1]